MKKDVLRVLMMVWENDVRECEESDLGTCEKDMLGCV
jgi:hypothetical protein